MIIDTTLSAMENRMDGFRRLDEAVERKKISDFPGWAPMVRRRHAKKMKEEKKFEKRMGKMMDKVVNLFSVGRNIQKSRELSESSQN